MAAQAEGNPRRVPNRWWRVSLRAKGVAVLAVPMAALFAALFSIYWVEGDVRLADQTVVGAYTMRAGLTELNSSLLDAQGAVSTYLSTGEPESPQPLVAGFSARQRRRRTYRTDGCPVRGAVCDLLGRRRCPPGRPDRGRPGGH